MLSNLRTLWGVLAHLFRPKVTIQYPEQKAPLPPRLAQAGLAQP